MTRSLITWFFVGWFSLIFIVSRFQSILKFNVLYDFAILRMKLGVKGLINVPLLRNCSIVRSTIGWFDIVIVRLGDSVHFGFFSENFLFSLLFSFWGLFPSRIFLLKAFSFRCDYFGFFGNFLLPMSIFFFEVFFIFYLHAWLDPCGPGNYFPMVWIFFFRPDFFGCFDVVFLPSRSGLDPCGPALFFFNFRPIFSDVSPSDFRLLFGVFWTSIPQLHGHSFFWCTAVIHLSSDVFVGEYFARSRSFFFFCLCSDYLRHSVHNRMDFLSHFWRLGIFQRLSLAFDYFSAVLRLVPARPKSWLLSPCGSRSYSANFDPSFLMLRRGHKRLAAVVWQRGPLLFFRLFGGFWLFTTGGVPLKYTVNGRQASDLRSGAPRWSLRLHHTASLDSGSLYWISCDQLLYYDY